MGFFYFDESIHPRGEFILGAWVYSSDDLSASVSHVLSVHSVEEFKSGEHMSANPRQRTIRDAMWSILKHTKVGLVVAPIQDRPSLGSVALEGLRKIIVSNKLDSMHHEVFLDQGVGFVDRDELASRVLGELDCTVHFDCDSRRTAGIQLADLAAHSMSIMLLEEMGIVTKTVKAGDNSGYDPDTDVEIGFALWASLRYQFFTLDEPNYDIDPLLGQMLDTATYALHISESCPTLLQNAALGRFGKCWLGCIH